MHDVNVVLDSSVPVMVSAFPSPSDPLITAPFKCVDESSKREMFSNAHDVMETSVDPSNIITALDTLTTLDGVKLTDVIVSVPDKTKKRE